MASPTSESSLLEDSIKQLRELLAPEIEIAQVQPSDVEVGDLSPDRMIEIRGSDGGAFATVLVEAKLHLRPADVGRVLAPRYELMRRLPSRVTPLLVSPWLSPRAREELERAGYNYLDLTGNVRLRIPRPAVLIWTEGAQRDPTPGKRADRRLAGPRTNALVRALVDFEPPYRAGDLEKVSGISLSYITRLLDVMDDLGLITRDGRVLTEVDWLALLRERSREVSLLKTNPWVSYVSSQGIAQTLQRLANADGGSVVVTGSVAAQAVAPTAVGGQLMLYVRSADIHEPDRVARQAGLLRSEQGNVLILRAASDAVFDRTREVNGLAHVALSQLALDCMSGPGRMPAEGEAILEYMAANVGEWRARLTGNRDPLT